MRICTVCGEKYDRGREMTCSDDCHKELVKHLIAQFGEFKKVVCMTTGVTYKVPTIDIIERGVWEQDLDQYPIWDNDEV